MDIIPSDLATFGSEAKNLLQDLQSRNAVSYTHLDVYKRQGRINAYNMAVLGIQNYYCIATNIYNNLTDVNLSLIHI